MARRYRRRGHYRRSPNGGRHYVRAHAVTRSSRSSRRPLPARSLHTAPIRTRPPAAPLAPRSRFFQPMPPEPNATCPICGARVYFWRNQSGSKVWFDALGHPWPKHPCLDVAVATTREIQTRTGLRIITRLEVREAQRSAAGQLPPTRVVTAIAPPETGGCLDSRGCRTGRLPSPLHSQLVASSRLRCQRSRCYRRCDFGRPRCPHGVREGAATPEGFRPWRGSSAVGGKPPNGG